MSRVLLINPAFDVENGFGDYQDLMEAMPVIGLAYLAATCREAGHTVRCLDNFIENLSADKVVELAREWKADVVGIGVLTPSIRIVEDLGRRLKKGLPHCRVVMGNLHASLFAEDMIRDGITDFVLHGEAERSMATLLNVLDKGGALSDVPGLTYMNGGLHTTPIAPQMPGQELDALPYPAWDLFPKHVYGFLPFVNVAKPGLSIIGSRGCPFHCTYCALGYQGHKVRRRSPDNIAAEIEWLVVENGIRHVGFVDPIFPVHKQHGIDTCRAIRERKIPGEWWWTTETRVDVIDEEMCREMREARCKRILFGIESGIDELLKNVKKKCTSEDIRRGVRHARQAGLEISAFFMVGLPGETAEQTRANIEFARSLDIDFAKFGITIPYPGTEIYDDLVASGKLERANWDKFSTFNHDPNTLPFIPRGLTGDELIRLHRRATFRFYVRPRMVLRHLFVIRSIGLRQMWNGAKIMLKHVLRKQL